MPTNTYVALATQTLSSTQTSVTFSSIPQGYTDLVLVANTFTSGTPTLSGNTLRVGNGTVDSGSNYSDTLLFGNGSTANSNRRANETYMQGWQDSSTTVPAIGIFNFMNYSNTTTNKTVLTRESRSDSRVSARVNLWRSNSAINIITVFSPDFGSGSTPFTAGSTFTIYGIAATSVGAKATGGTIYSDSSYYYHVFGASGTFTPTQSISADVLVVAGGGSGGTYVGGGGGAGGVLLYSAQSLTATGYTCTVGGGGASIGAAGNTGGSPSNGNVGTNSSFTGLTAAAGGGGGGGGSSLGTGGGNGGSGGGGGGNNLASSFAGGTGSQGNNGGAGSSSASNYPGGGGGGAGAVGQNGITSGAQGGGNGGIGTNAYSTWLSATGFGVDGYIAAGGGGDSFAGTAGVGGTGGGGNGSHSAGVAGRANTGSGGGGAGSQQASGSGGSGVIIVRYPK